MPFAQFHYPFAPGSEELFAERFPADYICEAIDQTRGWFYSLLAESTLLFDETSYLNCVCLGLILDPEGQKMSKSRGNVVDPWEVIDAHGADALRWYYFTAQQAGPWAGYRFSLEAVNESVRQFLLTLWNTYSFLVLYANAADGQPEADRTGSEDDLDRWAVSRLQGVIRTVRVALDDFDSTTSGRAIAAYVDELSNWYVRLSRRRFWDGDPEALATLRHCLVEVAKLVAPFTPFLADEIHDNLTGGGDSVHLADFPVADESLVDAGLEAGMEAAQRAVELGRAARAHGKVKMRQPLRKAVVVAAEDERATLERFSGLVTAELNVKELEFVSEEGDLATYSVKPDYRRLGPRFGKRMPQAAAAIEALDPAAAAAMIAGERRIGIQLDGADHDLEPDDVTLVMEPLEGYQVEAESGRAVALALELDDELRREGLAREVVRAVQNARKEAGLDVTDRIELGLGGDEELVSAAREHEAYVAGETLATAISYDGSGGEPAKIEGRELRIDVARAT
jgi:isoleucyl-tRNA synthetase